MNFCIKNYIPNTNLPKFSGFSKEPTNPVSKNKKRFIPKYLSSESSDERTNPVAKKERRSIPKLSSSESTENVIPVGVSVDPVLPSDEDIFVDPVLLSDEDIFADSSGSSIDKKSTENVIPVGVSFDPVLPSDEDIFAESGGHRLTKSQLKT
jgi:DNA repair photolyase